MAYTKDDVGPRQVNGELVELSDAEKQAIVDEWNNPVDNRTYAEKRKDEYPPMDEIVVALWEAVIDELMASSIELQGKRTAVKDKYPKP